LDGARSVPRLVGDPGEKDPGNIT